LLADSQTGLCCAFLHDLMIELSLPRRCVLQISSMEADVSAADDVEALIRAHRKLFVKLPLEAVLPLPPAPSKPPQVSPPYSTCPCVPSASKRLRWPKR
jgi:hypothetical protein